MQVTFDFAQDDRLFGALTLSVVRSVKSGYLFRL